MIAEPAPEADDTAHPRRPTHPAEPAVHAEPGDPPHVGALLRRRRQQLGLTLSQLAAAVDAAPSYLSMIENRRVDNPPSSALLDRLEAALHITDRALHHAADWQSTPDPIRATLTQLADDAQRGRRLAAWLKQHTQKRTRKSKPHESIGRDLDRLYRSGQLSRRINAVLRTPPAPGETPENARYTNGKNKPPQSSSSRPAASVFPLRDAPRIPLINRVAAGLPSTFTDLDFPAGVADDYLAVPGLDDPDAFATRVTGASMEPAYAEGDLVVFSPAADVTDGCDAFVRLEPEHEVTFKRVFFDEAAGTIRLQPLNPQFAPRVFPREEVAGLFRAVWRFAKL